ncbi:Hypothetical predicted protein [Octopus vulgaris]|uniref:Protein quiver n=1 Tax=Octopus vulgaris TaxID=6645 RepID=A0AA36AX78_OCTVU|nr:Hypothetical predicted protein [Octopus vulgaris]
MIYVFGSNVGFLCTILIAFIATINAVQGMIQCSRCDSRRDKYYGECEQSPPPPTPCPKNSNSLYCSIVRETDLGGMQLRFARDCISMYVEEKCIVKNVTASRKKTSCIRTCDVDGCNGEGLKLRGGSSQHCASFVLISLTIILINA